MLKKQPNNQIQINKASTHYKQPNIAIRETEVDILKHHIALSNNKFLHN